MSPIPPVLHLTLSRLPATLFERTRLGKTGFQIEGSDLIQFIMEDRLRHASGPVQSSRIRYIYLNSAAVVLALGPKPAI